MLVSIIASFYFTCFVAALYESKEDFSSVLALNGHLESKSSFSQIRLRRGQGGLVKFCSEVTEHPFANCQKLRSAGKCEYSVMMRKWCPKTCQYCIKSRAAAPVPCHLSKYGCCADGIQVAKGKNRLGCPEKCKDYDKRNCNYYASNGFCTNKAYTKIIMKLCPEACKLCGKKVVNGCYNRMEDSFCTRFAGYGYCRVPKMKARMHKYCARSCEACGDNVPRLSDVTPKCAEKGCCWDNITPISKGCPPCRDKYSQILCKRFKPDCYYVDRMQATQMRIFCSDTCGICNRRVCKDDHTFGVFCDEWKSMGECKKNPVSMRLFCSKTCKFC